MASLFSFIATSLVCLVAFLQQPGNVYSIPMEGAQQNSHIRPFNRICAFVAQMRRAGVWAVQQ